MPDYDSDQEDEDVNDGWGHSLYNDDKGIKVTIIFTPLPSAAPVKKRRANAKPPVITKISYFHEKFALKDFVSKIVIILKRDDLLEKSWLYHGYEREEPNSFSIFYTIPRRVVEQVEIHESEDYMQMVEEATQKNSAEVKVFIIEQKTQGEEDSDEDSEHEEAAARKKKKNLPSEEEVAQATIIQDLERRHRCEDRNCAQTPCYVAGPDAEHVHLTHMHLRTWAAAIEGKVDGVDAEHPPNSKIFDPDRRQNTNDIALLAKRRLAQNRETVAPAITVNFPGFAEIFRQPNAPALAGPLAPLPIPNGEEAPRPLRQQPPLPPMKLDVFCALYELSDAIKDKLIAIHITGPHILRLISDTDLRGEGGLSVGELASVRDAQLRWSHGAVAR